jgi:hypothetical protein
MGLEIRAEAQRGLVDDAGVTALTTCAASSVEAAISLPVLELACGLRAGVDLCALDSVFGDASLGFEVARVVGHCSGGARRADRRVGRARTELFWYDVRLAGKQ